MESSVGSLEKLHATKASKAEKLRAQAEEVKASLVDAGSARLAAVRSRVGLVEKKIKETNDQFTKLEVDIKSAHRNEAKCEAKVQALEEEVVTVKEKLTTVEARMLEIEKTAKTCMDEFQELQKTVNPLNPPPRVACVLSFPPPYLVLDPRAESEAGRPQL